MIDRLYFIIYNSYYKDGQNNQSAPPYAVFGLFMVAIFCLGLTMVGAIYLIKDSNYFIKRNRIEGKVIIFLISALITYLLFYYNKRYLNIYESYKDINVLNSSKSRTIAFLIIYSLIFSPLICALIYNKIHLGRWI